MNKEMIINEDILSKYLEAKKEHLKELSLYVMLEEYENIKKENKNLKHQLEQTFNDTKDTYNEICAEQIDYKSRNEKAIELLKEAGCYDEETKTFCDDVWEELPNLLSILNGGDE